MLVTCKTNKKPIIEPDDDFYDTDHGRRQVAPRNAEGLPTWLTTYNGSEDNKTKVKCGYSSSEGQIFYITCAGNWINHTDTGIVTVGGQRQGIPWHMLGIEKNDIASYEYQSTMLPDSHPFASLSTEEAETLASNLVSAVGLKAADVLAVNKRLLEVMNGRIVPKKLSPWRLRRWLANTGIAKAGDVKLIISYYRM